MYRQESTGRNLRSPRCGRKRTRDVQLGEMTLDRVLSDVVFREEHWGALCFTSFREMNANGVTTEARWTRPNSTAISALTP